MYFTVNIFYIIISQVLIDYLNNLKKWFTDQKMCWVTIYNKLG